MKEKPMLPPIGSHWKLADGRSTEVYTVTKYLDYNGYQWLQLSYSHRCDIAHEKPSMIEMTRCPGCTRVISPGAVCESTITVEPAWFERRAKEAS